MKEKRVLFLKEKTVVLDEYEVDFDTLADDEIEGHTICSLISAGTEINGNYLNTQGWEYPRQSGYTAVFKVEKIGKDVKSFSVGDLAYASVKHLSFQKVKEDEAVKVPEGLDPKEALFARMSSVSAATMYKINYRPGAAPVLVMGLGNVGLMGLQFYNAMGYEVVGTDIDAKRVQLARNLTGLKVVETLGEEYNDYFGVALECSGSQKATLDCCKALKKEGELSLVGVPWKPTEDIQSYEVLNKIFYKYLKCYSGWEMDLPLSSKESMSYSRIGLIRLSMRLLAEKRMKVKGLFTEMPASNPQKVYDAIYNRQITAPSVVFNWAL